MSEDALQHSRETRHLLNTHIDVTRVKLDALQTSTETQHRAQTEAANERYAQLNANIARMESVMKWAGGVIISLILTVLGWALVQQINANESQKRDLQQQLDLLKAQQAQRLELLSRSGAADTGVAPHGAAKP